MAFIHPVKCRLVGEDFGFEPGVDSQVSYEPEDPSRPEVVGRLIEEVAGLIGQPLQDWPVTVTVSTYGRVSPTELGPCDETSFRCICSFGADEVYRAAEAIFVPQNSCCVLPPSIAQFETVTVSAKPRRTIQGQSVVRAKTYRRLVCVLDVQVPSPAEPAPTPAEPIPSPAEPTPTPAPTPEDRIKQIQDMSQAAMASIDDQEIKRNIRRLTKCFISAEKKRISTGKN